MQGSERAIESSEAFEDEQRERRVAGIRDGLTHSGRHSCLDCGATIPSARRLAMPSATRCIPCQEAHEGKR